MNEKIKELAIEAGYEKDMFGIGHWDMPECKKFAELIVLECSKVIVNGGYRNLAFGEKHPLTPPEIATTIKEHFGIE
jgi:hypothetical protein